MVVVAPPNAPAHHDELEALIEEARRRARRRRLAYLAAGIIVVVAAGTVATVVALMRGGGGTALPEGFRVVHARGPVQRAVLEHLPSGFTTVDVASGRARPTRGTQEIWWDARLGMAKEDFRQDGRLLGSFPQQNCAGSGPGRFCIPPPPFDVRPKGLVWSPKPGSARRVGEGTFRGRRVIWIEGLVRPDTGKPYLSGDQAGYDALTHRLVALRTISRDSRFKGRVFSLTAVTMLPDLPADDVSFVVPKQGMWRNPPSSATTITGQRLPAARKALGTTPLWLGRSFEGHQLQSVVTGIESEQAPTTGRLRPARFARFDYGAFSIQEFGQDRPFWQEEEPLAGSVVFTRDRAVLARDGVLLAVQSTGPKFRIDRAEALALARALRPLR
jgi:hypothetical protein